MNRTVNQLVNALHLDPKREAAVRKIIENAGGVNDSTPVVNEISGNELLPINVNGENKAVSAAALVKGAKEVYVVDLNNYTADSFISLKTAIEDNKIINIKEQNIMTPTAFSNVSTNSIFLISSIIAPKHFGTVDGSTQKTEPSINIRIYLFSDDGTYNTITDILNFDNKGDGTKFLSDDGTYKEVGGGSEPYIWDGTASETKFAELKAAIESNKIIKYNLAGMYYLYAQEAFVTDEGMLLYFSQGGCRYLYIINTTNVELFYIDNGKAILNDSNTLVPTKYNIFTVTKDSNLSISESDAQFFEGTLAVEYEGELNFGDTVYNVTFPEGVKWSTDSVLEYKANHTYQFRILNNLGVMKEFAN